MQTSYSDAIQWGWNDSEVTQRANGLYEFTLPADFGTIIPESVTVTATDLQAFSYITYNMSELIGDALLLNDILISAPEESGTLATQEWVQAQGYGSGESIDTSNLVTLNGEQTITSKKIFTNTIEAQLVSPTILTFDTFEGYSEVDLSNLSNFTQIDWGDGTIDTNSSHDYNGEGTYTCKIYGLTSINEMAFSNVGMARLTSVIIGDSVTEIGNQAFFRCENLTSVVIPNSVTSIGEEAFASCISLTSVVIPDSVTSIGYGAFYDCTGLTSIVIPNSVTSIGSYAFSFCYSLTSVVIPDSVTEIGAGVFAECYSLTSVVIPDSVTEIGDSAFKYCTSLTSVVIPEGVTYLGYDAFAESPLTKITFKSPTPVDYDSSWFSTVPTIVVPRESIDAYKTEWPDLADHIISETPATQEWVESQDLGGAIDTTADYNWVGDHTFEGSITVDGSIDFTSANITGLPTFSFDAATGTLTIIAPTNN